LVTELAQKLVLSTAYAKLVKYWYYRTSCGEKACEIATIETFIKLCKYLLPRGKREEKPENCMFTKGKKQCWIFHDLTASNQPRSAWQRLAMRAAACSISRYLPSQRSARPALIEKPCNYLSACAQASNLNWVDMSRFVHTRIKA